MLVTICVCGFKKMYPWWCRLLFALAGSKKCTRNIVGYSLCLWVQKNVPVMSVKLQLCLWVQKNAPATMLVALWVCGFKKKCTRNVSEVVALFMGSKKCIRDSVWLLFVFAGSKKIYPWCQWSHGCVCWFKKMHPQQYWLLFEFVGSKKYTRDVVGYSLSLRVQKNAPATILVAFRVRGFKKIYPWCRCSYGCVYGFKKIYPRRFWLLFVSVG